MKPKTIFTIILLILVFIILLNNNEQASFWLFKEIHTSKLIILSAFFLLGMITGAIVFRRRDKHPKEYNAGNPYGNIPSNPTPTYPEDDQSDLSDDDREYLRRD